MDGCAGNSAPFKKNLEDYLKKHPDWEEYWGQDLDEHGRKLFPRKRRRTSAEPSPALTAKSGPAAGEIPSMHSVWYDSTSILHVYPLDITMSMSWRCSRLTVPFRFQMWDSDSAFAVLF